MSCPSFHFPQPNVPRDPGRRELLSDSGAITGMCPIPADKGGTRLLFQKLRFPKDPVLCAAGPLLPLLPPNKCTSIWEPCLSRLNKDREEVGAFTRSIKIMSKQVLDRVKKGTVEEVDKLGLRSIRRHKLKYLEKLSAKYRADPYIPVVNKDYSGGCLASLHTADTQYLCLPVGPDQQKLSLYKMTSEGRLKLDWITSTELPRRIFQVDTAVVNDLCMFGVRTDEQCSLYKLRHSEEHGISFKRKRRLKFDSKPMSICMSPYIDGECVTLTSDGSLQLWDARGSAASETGSVAARFSGPDFWGHAAYSAHPRQVLVTDRTGVAVWDMRMRSRHEDVFVLPTPLLRSEERFVVGRPHPRNPFYHIVATEETVLMLDHRFPRLPVLDWCHMLPSPPQYLTVVSDVLPSGGDDVIMLSSQDRGETVCYQVRMATVSLPPVCTSAPWRLAKPEDLFHTDGTQMESESINRRLMAPLTGVTALKSSRDGGFSVAQLTSYGDLFGQQYVVGTSDMERTWCSGPGSSHLRLNHDDRITTELWQASLLSVTKAITAQQQAKERETGTHRVQLEQETYSASEDRILDKEGGCYMPEKLTGLLPAHDPESWCKLCGEPLDLSLPDQPHLTRVYAHGFRPSESLTALHKCSGCQMTEGEGLAMHEAVQMGHVIPTKISDETVDAFLDYNKFQSDSERFMAAKSKIIQKLWQDEDVEHLLKQRDAERMKAATVGSNKTTEQSRLESQFDEETPVSPAGSACKTAGAGQAGSGYTLHSQSQAGADSVDAADSDASSVLCRVDGGVMGDVQKHSAAAGHAKSISGGAAQKDAHREAYPVTPKTSRKRSASPNDSDGNTTPLTMFSQEFSGSPFANTSFGGDTSFGGGTPTSQTPSTRKAAKRLRRSVMGF